MKTSTKRFKLAITTLLMLFAASTSLLLAGCKSEEEKQIQEQHEKLLAPRKEKVDARNAKEFDPF